MVRIFSILILTALSTGDGPGSSDVQSLIATIESLQDPVQDFRCEFEGTTHFKGKVAAYTPVGADGLYETFAGTYIWRKGGDIRSESLHRVAVNGQISRHTLAVRSRDHQAVDVMSMGHPREVPNIRKPTGGQWGREGLGEIFPINYIKWMATDADRVLAVSNGEFEGLTVKVLSVSLKGLRDSLIAEYFVDLHRSGHVVRIQSYTGGKVLSSWFDIKLARFNVGDVPVWMPVSGESVGLMAVQDGRPILTKEHTSIRKFRVVDGTMEFNKHPGPEVFTTQYKPGPPTSQVLRKLENEFALQRIRLSSDEADNPETIVEKLTSVGDRIAEVVVVSPPDAVDRTKWIACGSGALVLVLCAVLWNRRRMRRIRE